MQTRAHQKIAAMNHPVFSIGHSTHPQAQLFNLLKQHGVTALYDVRSQPYSRRNPQFNREVLQTALLAAGIGYGFLGKELGARPSDQDCYRDGQVQYDVLAATECFRRGIQKICTKSEQYRIVLMCAEKDPILCHRTILISRYLAIDNTDIYHIHADGTLETHEKCLQRLMRRLRLPESDLFRSREEMIANAYALQGKAIAYRAKLAKPPGTA